MASMIERIASAEAEAEKIVQSSQANAKAALADGKAALEKAVADAVAEERQKTRDALLQAEKDGNALSEELHQQQLRQTEEILKKASGNRDAAVQKLLERIEAIV